jgi:hypothetical protein
MYNMLVKIKDAYTYFTKFDRVRKNI